MTSIGIIGAGTMGRGIAQLAAASGCHVTIEDARPGAAAEAATALAATFAKLAARGKMPDAEAKAAAARIIAPEKPDFSDCDVIVEAIIEDLAAKQALFARLEGEIREDCILATNTSSLSVTAIAAGCRRPERVAGFHFFNPVPLMRIVEVVAGCRTAAAASDFLKRLGESFGHRAVVVADSPGFLVNHAGRGFGPEALRILAEGVAAPEEIDRILVEQAGFRMGPFELFDLVGLDVSEAVMESIYQQFHHEPRYRPSALVRARVAAGLLGRKTGAGFYHYAEGAAIKPPEPALPSGPGRPIWISQRHPEAARQLAEALNGVEFDPGAIPAADSLCLVTPFGLDASAAALDEGLDAARVVAVDCLLGFSGRRVAMATPATRPEMRDAALCALAGGGHAVSLIKDSAGFVSQRVLAMVINIACDIAQQRVAAPADIDTAVRLGLGYPHGPLSWGDAIGAARVLAILEDLEALTGEARYRPSPWLRRRAGLGLPLVAED